MDWKECWDKRIVKDIKKDEQLISSLIKTSENRLKTEEKIEIDNITCPKGYSAKAE